jgi:hypothetical protein
MSIKLVWKKGEPSSKAKNYKISDSVEYREGKLKRTQDGCEIDLESVKFRSSLSLVSR